MDAKTQRQLILLDKCQVSRDLLTAVSDEANPELSFPDWELVLGDIERLAQTVASARRTAVELARLAGLTWAEVGRQLGITAQGAQQRYGSN
jgi:DNA-directed RNA polymerase specialized sigma24 family protein